MLLLGYIPNIASKSENKTVVENSGEVFEELLNGVILEEHDIKEADEFLANHSFVNYDSK